ncbi:unnamed protein product [Scytosiphon promiscuus]
MEFQTDAPTNAQPLLEQHGRANDELDGIELQAARSFRKNFDNLHPEPAGALLRYSVKIHNGDTRSPGSAGDSPAATPQPVLGSYAPFPYGHASVPGGWEPTSENPTFLSVPPLYDSDTTDQTQEPPPVDAGGDRGCRPTIRSPPPSRQEPMSLKRRLGGCILLAFLGVHSFFFLCTWAFLPDQLHTPRLVLVVACFLCYAGFLLSTIHEARESKLGRVMRADVVAIDRVAGFLDGRSSDVAPGIEFLAFQPGTDDQPQRQQWMYDEHQDVSLPVQDVMSHIAQLVSRFEVVRLRLPVRATLADERTKGDFITALHKLLIEVAKPQPRRGSAASGLLGGHQWSRSRFTAPLSCLAHPVLGVRVPDVVLGCAYRGSTLLPPLGGPGILTCLLPP